MRAARGAIQGVVRFLTAGLSPRLAGGGQAGSTLTILAVLEPQGYRG